MFKILDIEEHMEVVGSDDKHVGTVDHKEHLIWIDWVDYVDRKVHLNKPSQKVISEWQAAA
jgi:hypothetical protein